MDRARDAAAGIDDEHAGGARIGNRFPADRVGDPPAVRRETGIAAARRQENGSAAQGRDQVEATAVFLRAKDDQSAIRRKGRIALVRGIGGEAKGVAAAALLHPDIQVVFPGPVGGEGQQLCVARQGGVAVESAVRGDHAQLRVGASTGRAGGGPEPKKGEREERSPGAGRGQERPSEAAPAAALRARGDGQPVGGRLQVPGHVLEQLLHVGHVLPALGRILVKAFEEQAHQRARRLFRGKRRRFAVEDGGQGADPGILLERGPARHHLVEHTAEAEHVRARIDGPALGLLR